MKRVKLQQARYRKGLSQEALAEEIGVSRNAISQWENGRTTPYPLYLGKLCAFFGVDDPAALDVQMRQGEPFDVVEEYQDTSIDTSPPPLQEAPLHHSLQDIQENGRPAAHTRPDMINIVGTMNTSTSDLSTPYTDIPSHHISDDVVQREHIKWEIFLSSLGPTFNGKLFKDIISRNFSKGVTYDFLSSNVRTMNFRDEWQYVVNNLVSEATVGLRAMVFDVELTRWWNTVAGQIYMMTNMDLLKRGIPVKRIFILSSLDARLRMNTLMNAYVHHKIGIDVRVCKVTGFQEFIPFKPDMFSVHDNLFVALYYFSREKPLTNLLLEDTYISDFRSFYDELFMDDRLCTRIEAVLASANCGEGFFAAAQIQLEFLRRLERIGSITELATKFY